MSNSPSKGSDIMIAVGAILCIALGASVTYWITHSNARKAMVAVGAQVAQPAAAPASDGTDFLPVSFSTLSSYNYEIQGADDTPLKKEFAKDQIPQPIKDLNGKKISIQGYMVPIDLKNGKTTKFLLVKDQSLCCFGRMPRMNELVSIFMKPGKSARVIQDQPVTVIGDIEVGEKVENGEVICIYRVNSDDVAGPLDL